MMTLNTVGSRRFVLLWRTLSVQPIKTAVSKGQANATQAQEAETTLNTCGKFDDIPGPKGLPVLGNLLNYYDKGFKFHKAFEIQENMFKTYGPIYKDKIMQFSRVNIINPTDMEEIFRADGKYPDRPRVDPWIKYRQRRGYSVGLTQEYGEEWDRIRKSFATKMLRPLDIQDNMGNLNHVISDFMARLIKVQEKNGEIPDLAFELFRWSTESIGTFIFDSRLGLLDNPPRDEPERFVKATQDFLRYTQELRSGPPFYKIMETPAWKGFCKASDFLIETGKKYVEEKAKQLSEKAAKEDIPDKRASLLEHMLTKGELATQEIIIQATELLMAGVDTTAQTCQWTLYLLAKHPEIQQKLYSEIASVINADEPVTAAQLTRVPFLRACLKEATRLYPSTYANFRIVQQDLVLSGYVVPAGTIVQMNLYIQGRSELYFKNATQFQPERWLRETGKHFHPFASLPFGFGPRMCPGKRIAELEIHMFLAKIIRKFKLEYYHSDVEPVLRMFMIPEKPLRIKFVER